MLARLTPARTDPVLDPGTPVPVTTDPVPVPLPPDPVTPDAGTTDPTADAGDPGHLGSSSARRRGGGHDLQPGRRLHVRHLRCHQALRPGQLGLRLSRFGRLSLRHLRHQPALPGGRPRRALPWRRGLREQHLRRQRSLRCRQRGRRGCGLQRQHRVSLERLPLRRVPAGRAGLAVQRGDGLRERSRLHRRYLPP